MHTVTADLAPAGVRQWSDLPGAGARPRRRDRHPRLQRGAGAGASIHRLHRFLDTHLPFSLADHDRRQRQHRHHARDRASRSRPSSTGVRVLRLEQKGRGRALRAAWSASRAASSRTWTSTCRPTCTRCCRCSRRCSRATARSRSARAWRAGSRVARGPKREFISRAYNHILRAGAARTLHRRPVRVQGGPRRRCCPSCSTAVRDEAWFFDTELLIAAQRARDAHPRGSGRLGRRSRLARRHRLDRAR